VDLWIFPHGVTLDGFKDLRISCGFGYAWNMPVILRYWSTDQDEVELAAPTSSHIGELVKTESSVLRGALSSEI